MDSDRLEDNESLSDRELIYRMRKRKNGGKPVSEIVTTLRERRTRRRNGNQGDSTPDLERRLRIRQRQGKAVTEIQEELDRRGAR